MVTVVIKEHPEIFMQGELKKESAPDSSGELLCTNYDLHIVKTEEVAAVFNGIAPGDIRRLSLDGTEFKHFEFKKSNRSAYSFLWVKRTRIG